MAYQHLPKSLETLATELKQFLGPVFFETEFVRHLEPWGRPEVLDVGHEGCYLAVTGTHSNYSTITFEIRIDLTQWGKPEVLAIGGKFIDGRYGGDRYERWYNSPFGNPYMLDIFDRVDRMAAYAIRLLEKHARETLDQPDFQLMPSVPASEVQKVVDYFRQPVQIDYRGG